MTQRSFVVFSSKLLKLGVVLAQGVNRHALEPCLQNLALIMHIFPLEALFLVTDVAHKHVQYVDLIDFEIVTDAQTLVLLLAIEGVQADCLAVCYSFREG